MAYVPDAAVDRCQEITGLAFKVYAVYCKHSDRKTACCYPRAATVAKTLGVATHHVYRARKELQAANWIAVETQGPNKPPLIMLLMGFEGAAHTSTKTVPPTDTKTVPVPKGNGGTKTVSATSTKTVSALVPKEYHHQYQNSTTHIRKEPAHVTSPCNQPILNQEEKNTPSLRSGVPETGVSGVQPEGQNLFPEGQAKTALARVPQARKPNPEYETFAATYLERFGIAYRYQRADFVQLDRLRKAVALAPDYWQRACLNYVTTPMGKYTLADLSTRVEVFAQGRLDQYNKPANALYQFNLAEGAAWLQRNKERDEKSATH